MTRRTSLLYLLPVLVLLACSSDDLVGPVELNLEPELVDLGDRTGPPDTPEGACWQSDDTPAAFETVTEQVLVQPETLGADGKMTRPAVYATQSRQAEVGTRKTIWFQIPCPEVMTEDFTASMQRALKARGLFTAPLTGRIDKPTRAAILDYQSRHGLMSSHLTLATARHLGLIEIGR